MTADPRVSIAEIHGLPPEAAEHMSGASNAELHAEAAALAALRSQREALEAAPANPLFEALGISKVPTDDVPSFEDVLVNGQREFKQRQADDEARVARRLRGES